MVLRRCSPVPALVIYLILALMTLAWMAPDHFLDATETCLNATRYRFIASGSKVNATWSGLDAAKLDNQDGRGTDSVSFEE